MVKEQVQTVLRRKAEAGKPAPDGAPQTPERAISQALARVAQDSFDLPLQVGSARESRMSLAELPEILPDLALLAVIEGPGEGLGLVALAPETLAALIEAQTMGQLAKAAPAPRRPTRIDAAMAADFIDGVLSAIEEGLAGTAALLWAGGFRYASYLDDPRPLGLLLEDISYRVWQVELELGTGLGRTGGLIWAVPAVGRGALGAARAASTGAPGAEGAGGGPPPDLQAEVQWSAALERSVSAAPAVLDAVLHRVTLPLSAVLGLRVGTDLPLPMDALEHLTVEAGERRRISSARLGQLRGYRAVRLVEDQDEEADEMTDAAMPRGGHAPKLAEFSAGESPFADSAGLGAAPSIGRMGDPDAAIYDSSEPLEVGDLGGFGFDAGGDLPPLDGFGALGEDDELPPLKIAGL